MKKILLPFFCLLTFFYSHGQLSIRTQFVNPCGGDEHNEFIIAKTGATPVNIADVAFGSYNPSTNNSGTGGTAVTDYNYWWAGSNVPTNPYPTFSSSTAETCGSAGLGCYGFLYPSTASPDAADITTLINQLNTTAGCNVFLSVPNTNVIPANSNVIFFLGAGYRGSSALCGFDNLATNMNFANHCSGGAPIATYYAVFGKGNGAGVNCTTTTGGYFSNSNRRISTLHTLNGGINTDPNNYTTTSQDYNPGSTTAGTAGFIIPSATPGVGTWQTNQGCIPVPGTLVPIKFTALSANKVGDKTILNWKISNIGQQLNKFIVEKSSNGISYFPLGDILPSQNNNINYSFTEVNSTQENAYYRIKVISTNNAVDYSNTIFLKTTSNINSNTTLSPNPTKGNTVLTYFSTSQKDIFINIFDVTGLKLSQSNYSVSKFENKIELPTQALHSGSYIIQLISDTEKINKILIKN